MDKQQFLDEFSKLLSENYTEIELRCADALSDLSLLISSERIKRGMNQSQFAKFMEVTQPMVSKWESGDYNFTVEALITIAVKLGLHFSNPLVEPTPQYIYDTGRQHKPHVKPPVPIADIARILQTTERVIA